MGEEMCDGTRSAITSDIISGLDRPCGDEMTIDTPRLTSALVTIDLPGRIPPTACDIQKRIVSVYYLYNPYSLFTLALSFCYIIRINCTFLSHRICLK